MTNQDNASNQMTINWVDDGRKKPRHFEFIHQMTNGYKIGFKIERNNMKYWLTVKTNNFSYVVKDHLPRLKELSQNILDNFIVDQNIAIETYHGNFQRFRNGYSNNGYAINQTTTLL